MSDQPGRRPYRPDLYGPMTDVNERGYGWHDPKPAPTDGHAFDGTSDLLACRICQCSKRLHEPAEGCPCGSGVSETDCHPGTRWADVMGTSHVETCGATYGGECDRCPTDKGSSQ